MSWVILYSCVYCNKSVHYYYLLLWLLFANDTNPTYTSLIKKKCNCWKDLKVFPKNQMQEQSLDSRKTGTESFNIILFFFLFMHYFVCLFVLREWFWLFSPYNRINSFPVFPCWPSLYKKIVLHFILIYIFITVKVNIFSYLALLFSL